jgi:hypothetical protein
MGSEQLRGAQTIRYSSLSRVCPNALAFQPGKLKSAPCTGEGKLIVMTPSFDVLHESILYTNEFGEGKDTFPLLVDSRTHYIY